MLAEQRKTLLSELRFKNAVRLRELFECHVQTALRLGAGNFDGLTVENLSDSALFAAVEKYLEGV